MTTQELLKLTDDELLIAAAPAYWGLMGKTEFDHNEIETIHDQVFKQASCARCNEVIAHFYTGGDIEKVVVSKHCLIPDPIPCCCIDKVAFEMRDACVVTLWDSYLQRIATVIDMRGGIDGEASRLQAYRVCNQRHWVIAAMLAWEAQAK